MAGQGLLELSDEIVRALYTGVLSDVLDSFGVMDRALKPFVRPLDASLPLFGRVRTGRYEHIDPAAVPANPYEIEIELIDDLNKGDVPVLACGGPTDDIAPWGELLTTAAIARGSRGCVTDGLVRDTRIIKTLDFPVFCGGIGPLDTRGRARMVERDGTVLIAGAPATTGDYVFGDGDGVVILPAEIAEDVVRKALDKAKAEDTTRLALREGRLLREVFDEYGVL